MRLRFDENVALAKTLFSQKSEKIGRQDQEMVWLRKWKGDFMTTNQIPYANDFYSEKNDKPF